MTNVEYFFDKIKITAMENFEKELRDALTVAWDAGGWILSALVPIKMDGLFVIIFHRLTNS